MIALCLLPVLVQLVSAQLNFGNGPVANTQLALNMPQITNIQVKCSDNGMLVNIDFDQSFGGVIYTKGRFTDPRCSYVEAGSDRSRYSFSIRPECGTNLVTRANGNSEYSNTIIIQMDPDIQEIWDVARTLKCQWADEIKKTIDFTEITVGMLSATEVVFKEETVRCTMDIFRGLATNNQRLVGSVQIGETLSLAISIFYEGSKNYGLFVHECVAFDSNNPINRRTIQLSGTDGCPLRPKLMGPFSSRNPGLNGAQVTTVATLQAFKFPTTGKLLLSCKAKICKGSCGQNQCSIDPSGTDDNNVVVPPPTRRPNPTETPVRPPTRRPVSPNKNHPFHQRYVQKVRARRSIVAESADIFLGQDISVHF